MYLVMYLVDMLVEVCSFVSVERHIEDSAVEVGNYWVHTAAAEEE
jgi:hypothetical protein